MAHGKLVTVSELQLGDIVDLQFPDNVHSTASVTQIEGGLVSLTRPYLVLSNFTCTAGVLWSLGVETVKFSIGDPRRVLRIRESDVLKHEARMLEEEAKQKAELTRLLEENRKLREARDTSEAREALLREALEQLIQDCECDIPDALGLKIRAAL